MFSAFYHYLCLRQKERMYLRLVWVNDKWYARDAEKQSMAIDSQ